MKIVRLRALVRRILLYPCIKREKLGTEKLEKNSVDRD